MNKIFNILSLAIIALIAIACDPVSEDERYIKTDTPSGGGGVSPDDTEVARKALVQEFTGQFCPNCPLGHEALDNIATQYGESAVIVSIHAGDMAFDDPDFGLKTADGDAYAKEWGIQQYPSAIVNRKTVMPDRSQWQGAVFTALSSSTEVKIELEAQQQDGKINITSNLSATKSAVSAKYQLWIVEDGIQTLQQDGEEYIMDYTHNHVYRASANGIGGETVNIPAKEPMALQHTITKDNRWNADNLKVVAFVYTTNDVLQAEEIKISK